VKTLKPTSAANVNAIRSQEEKLLDLRDETLCAVLAVSPSDPLVVSFEDPFCPSLRTVIDTSPNETTYARVVVALLHGISVLASASISHGGLGPNCIFVDDHSIKLAPFDDPCVRYRSPELLSSSITSATSASDMWSFGTILYELLSRKSAFASSDVESLTIEHTQRRPQLKNSILWQLVGRCLNADPIARPSAAEAFALVKDFDWRDLPGCDRACVKSFISSLDPPQPVDIASLVPEGRDLDGDSRTAIEGTINSLRDFGITINTDNWARAIVADRVQSRAFGLRTVKKKVLDTIESVQKRRSESIFCVNEHRSSDSVNSLYLWRRHSAISIIVP
jgi:serine/threonine protein kinase